MRLQTKTHTKNRSIHWTNQYAVLDRVQAPELKSKQSQKPVRQIQFTELLPDQHVQARLLRRWAILVSRVISKYLTAFKSLRKKILSHIPHPYTKEMSGKSNLVRKPSPKNVPLLHVMICLKWKKSRRILIHTLPYPFLIIHKKSQQTHFTLLYLWKKQGHLPVPYTVCLTCTVLCI